MAITEEGQSEAQVQLNDTQVERGEHHGYTTYAVWDVDENGNKLGNYPVVRLGAKKLKAIIKHLDELQKMMDEDGKNV